MAVAFLMVSCGEDEPMVCDVLADSVTGTWNLTNLGGESGQITLEEDGTLIDDDNLIIEFENNGNVGDVKTWSLDGDDLSFMAAVDPAIGSGSASTTGTVTSFDCDMLSIDFGGFFTLTLTR